MSYVDKKLIYLWTFVVLSFGVFAGFFINKMMNSSNTSGAMSHPKAFVWLERKSEMRNEIGELRIEKSELAISKEQLANSHPEIAEGNSKQNENVTTEIENHAINSNNTTNNLLAQNVTAEKVKVHHQAKNNRHANSFVVTQSPILVNQVIAQNTVGVVDGLPLAGAIVSANLPIQNKVNNEAANSSSINGNNITPEVENLSKIDTKPLPVPTKDSAIETAPLAKVDSLITSPKNKAVLAQQVSDENYTGASLKKEKLTIIAYGGLGYSFMRYDAGNDQVNSATNQKLREQTESTESEITGGFLVGYDLTKRFTISSGLILANFKQTMNFSKETAKNPMGNYEENLRYFNDTITVGNTNYTSLKYSFTEIPFFITYKALETQKFELAFQTGLGIGFVTGINTYIINTNNIGVYEVTNKDDFPAFKNTLFFSFQPQFTYNLNSPGVSVGIMPIIKTSLTNIVSDENWLKQYPYNMSMNVFLRKRF